MMFLLKGILIGFSIAAPVGPIGVLCIQRTLAYGRRSGLVTGLGAATADGLYGAIAAFGVTAISSMLVGQQFYFRLIGGSFLLYLSFKAFLTRPAEHAPPAGHVNVLRDYASAFVLTLLNPVTILSFAAVFAGLGLGETGGDPAQAALMVAGVVSGSALWWLILSAGIGSLRSRFSVQSLRFVNRASGVVMAGFALLAFASI